jgi:GNAT superfamily N-acetyltransferase
VPFEIATLDQRPGSKEKIDRLAGEAWPTFMLHADTPHWGSLFDTFTEFQVLFYGPDGTLAALGHTIPFVWDGTREDLPPTINQVMERAMEDHRGGRTPTALSALAALVSPEHRGRGLSSEVLKAMRSLAASRGMHSLVAPVRPTLKSSYPITPIERYVRWKRNDGSPFDPWLRVHWRLGAEFLMLAPEAAVIEGTIPEWEGWTGMRFPESGEYVVPGALQPVLMDRDGNVGRYVDPNVWMRHPIAEGAANRSG